MPNGKYVDEAFFGGIIGLIIVFVEIKQFLLPIPAYVSTVFVVLFLSSGFLRVYGAILENRDFQKWSMYFFKTIVFTYSIISLPTFIYSQFPNQLSFIPNSLIVVITLLVFPYSLKYWKEVIESIGKDFKQYFIQFKKTKMDRRTLLKFIGGVNFFAGVLLLLGLLSNPLSGGSYVAMGIAFLSFYVFYRATWKTKYFDRADWTIGIPIAILFLIAIIIIVLLAVGIKL